MRGQWFKCGGNHWATARPKPVQGLQYNCPHCSNKLTISGRGQSVAASPQTAARSIAPLPPRTLAEPTKNESRKRSARPHAPAEVPASKASKAAASAAAAAAATAAACSVCKVVSVCDKTYTGLSWFLGQPNPSPSLCTRARTQCYHNALELSGSDLRTLLVHSFVAPPPKKPKPLLLGRARLSSEWLATPIKTEHAALKLRKTGQELTKANRQVLWLVTDLEKTSAKKQRGLAIKTKQQI
jgi:hypothetical protein